MYKYRLKVVSAYGEVFLSRPFNIEDEDAKAMFADLVEKTLSKGMSFMTDDGTIVFFTSKALDNAKEILLVEAEETGGKEDEQSTS